MEQVLDLYARPPDPDEPLIRMDEASKAAARARPRPPAHAPRRAPAREDDKDERHGTRAVFMFLAPHLGWRRVAARATPDAPRLGRGGPAAAGRGLPPRPPRPPGVRQPEHAPPRLPIRAAFPAAEARRLARRLTITYTPRNGSWLNVAEVELGIPSGQCLDRRIGDGPTLDGELLAWNGRRNAEQGRVIWHFTTADARVKLRHLYPHL